MAHICQPTRPPPSFTKSWCSLNSADTKIDILKVQKSICFFLCQCRSPGRSSSPRGHSSPFSLAFNIFESFLFPCFFSFPSDWWFAKNCLDNKIPEDLLPSTDFSHNHNVKFYPIFHLDIYLLISNSLSLYLSLFLSFSLSLSLSFSMSLFFLCLCVCLCLCMMTTCGGRAAGPPMS